MNNQTTPSTVHKAVALFLTLLVIFTIIFGVLSILSLLGIPSFIGTAVYFAYIYTVFINSNEIEVKLYSPLVNKIANIAPYISAQYNAAKTWVKGLFKKSETVDAAPAAAV